MKSRYVQFALAGVLVLGAPATFAAGTDANTDISNSATVDYSVGGVSQPTATSNTVTFEVDRKVNLTVAEVGTADTTVVPGASNEAVAFDVTNTTNDTIDILLTVTQQDGGPGPHADTDDFTLENVRIYRDDPLGPSPGSYDAGDTLVTALDNVAEDATIRVFVVADIPDGQADGSLAALTLTGQAADAATGTAFTESTGADTEDETDNDNADNVFADEAGDTDAEHDGRHSDDDAYAVSGATLSVVKTSRVVSDPINGTSNPKRIPGAIVEYCIVVANSGSNAADAVVVTDDLTGAPVTFEPDSIYAGGDAACSGGTLEDDDAAGANDTLSATENTGNFTGGTVTTETYSVPAGTSTSTRFRVTIN